MISDTKLSELLNQYKQNQGYYDDNSDEAIKNNLRYSADYALNAGVLVKTMEKTTKADGAIIRGAMDIWENAEFSRITIMMMSQLKGV